MGAEWAIERTYTLSWRCSVTMTAGPGGFVCNWSRKPGRWLNDAELAAYRAARDDILKDVATRMGGKVLVVDTLALQRL
jgi:hypothetical protein